MDKTIGIIGGGQLALMLIQSASKFGVRCICLDPNPQAIAFKYCNYYLNNNFDDIKALKELEQKCDVILYEFENIDLQSLKEIDNGKLFNGIEVLKYSQNRLLEKNLAFASEFKTVDYKPVFDENSLDEAIKAIGFGGILKTTTNGYDGKGQICIRDSEDLFQAKELLKTECIYEQKLDFDYEMSLIAVRNKKDEFSIFPPFINEHVGGILHKTVLTNNSVNEQIKFKANKLLQKFMKKNNFWGILCVEFFVKDEEIYFNEMAPRPHNSGHITIDATNTSQFDQYIRAALNFKMLNPKIVNPMGMINVLGQHIDLTNKLLLNNEQVKVYIYGKNKAVINRKMGHINMELNDRFNKINEEFKNVK